jgi:hypothetical protein
MIAASRFTAPRGARIFSAGLLAALATLILATSATASSSFVIGNQNAAVGSSVTFWGAQWWMENSLTGGPAPASFKGYANTPAGPPACGARWTTDPGNSSEPPAAPLPELINVIVASTVTKSGPTISGNTPEVVVVRTNPGYDSNPGHPGTGTVVAIRCKEGEGEPS